MKKWASLVGAVVVVVCALLDLTHEFYANDTLHYFASEPLRLFYVAGIAAAGGLVALVFSRFSHQAQHRLRLVGWGAAASFATMFFGYSLYQSVSLSPIIVANSGGVCCCLCPCRSLLLLPIFGLSFFEHARHEQQIHR